MKSALRLHPYMHANHGQQLSRDHPVAYEVRGLPDGQDARITFDGHFWRLSLTTLDGEREFADEFRTPDHALARLTGVPLGDSSSLSNADDIMRAFPLNHRFLQAKGRPWSLEIKNAWAEPEDPTRVHLSVHVTAIGEDTGKRIRVTVPTHLLVEESCDPVAAVVAAIEQA